MEQSVQPEWTAALVLCGLRKAFAREPELGQPPASFHFIVDHARKLLGADSRDYTALVLRTGPTPGLSIREMCRSFIAAAATAPSASRRRSNVTACRCLLRCCQRVDPERGGRIKLTHVKENFSLRKKPPQFQIPRAVNSKDK
jgi:hypothetical protein